MELFVYKGEFTLPSIDLDCLRVLMYIKLADVKGIKIRQNFSPFKSDNGFLPYLIDTTDNKKYCGYEKIVNFLKSCGYVLDASEKNEACLSFIRQNLYPYFMYTLFGSPQNLDETRALYATRTPFPFNFYYPSKYVRKTDEVCQALANFSLEDPIDHHDTAEMEAKAKKCLNWFSEKLGTNEFFLNGTQSEVDATVYAYLAVILKFQLPNNQLQAHAKQCENLVRYVNNLTKKYFDESECFESEKVKEQNQKKEQKVFTGQEEDGSPAEIRKRYIVSGLFATTAMIVYGYLHGIFSITLAEKLNEDRTTFSDYDREYVGDDDD
ncbi:metaxin-1 homolog [Chironomus tepperi]|uniref:metaxin-1 homolog n=1 Tax=Chironomus tepperi TaxID=113505 RepID=UPI00391F29AF